MKRLSAGAFIFTLFIIMALLIGCAEVPQSQIEAAQAALDEASKVEAGRYAQAEYLAAQDSLRTATAEIARQKSKFALLRAYDVAIQLLQSATLAANHAADIAKAQKETVHTETSDFLKQARAVVDTNKALLQNAPKGKKGSKEFLSRTAVLEAIQNDLNAVEAAIAEADSVMRTGDYLTAHDKANSCLAKANAVGEELKTTIAKMTAPMPKKRRKT